MRSTLRSIPTWLMLSLTLGLAPFFPEPHLWGKIRWIAGGAVGMGAMDWFDFLLHATPWAFLFRAIFLAARDRLRMPTGR
jgi:hypothetical protein